MSVADQSSHQECRETGHFRGDPAGFSRGKLVPVRQKQESGDYQKADGQRQQLRARKQGDRIANQSNQREGAHSTKGIGAHCDLVFFALQSYQERQEQNQDDLQDLRGQPLVDVH